ncbi:MAG: glycosyltransferase family 2 protein [Pseudobutyrivibrio sp.]|nr:glycosyltransferase family 2 protein [Pseudobutyrivibrio sp.]
MITFASVLYTQAGQFLPDLINSINNQTTEDFTCLFLNDNYETFPEFELKVPFTVATRFGQGLTPQLLRIELLKEAKKAGVDLLIIGDADDTFSPERVKSLSESYKADPEAVFYYNDLTATTGEKIFKDLPAQLTDGRQVSQSNFLGMSTTAINMKFLTEEWIETLYEGDTVIFDWYLYTRLLCDFGHANYVPSADTFYRIHDANEVGTVIDREREIKVKLTHYENLGKRYPYFKALYDSLAADKYKEVTPENGHWWNAILTEENNHEI